jgi:hypothetical protein
VWAIIEADCVELGLVSDADLRERAALKADFDCVYVMNPNPAMNYRARRDLLEDARRRLLLLVKRVIELGGTRSRQL